MPDRGRAATSPTSRRRATGHNAGERDTGERRDAGRELWLSQAAAWASTCRIVAKRLTLTGGAYPVSVRLPVRSQRLRRNARATGHNTRERGTGERRDAGREWPSPAGSRPAATSSPRAYFATTGPIRISGRGRQVAVATRAKLWPRGRRWDRHLRDSRQATTLTQVTRPDLVGMGRSPADAARLSGW